MDEASAIWRLWLARRRWEQARAEAEADGDQARVQEATQALAALPAVGVLEALRANAELVSVLTAQRWIAMKAAQEQGASSEEIGKALGISRQAAWEFLQRKIAAHRRQVPVHDATTGDPGSDEGSERKPR